MKPKILIFTSKTGGGHISLAEALRDELKEQYTIEMLDPQPGIVHWHYRLVSRRALWLWAWEFQRVDTPARSRAAHWLASRLMYPYVARALLEQAPDLVLTTYPFLTSEVTYAIKRLGRRRPFGMLLADPNSVHHAWLTETQASLVLATSRENYAQAAAAGFTSAQLKLVGWPVRAQFSKGYDGDMRRQILAGLQLNPESLTVFLQGGGEGAARFAQTVDNIHHIEDCQLILAAGTNQELIRRFSGLPRLGVLPFTKEIAPYMAAADVVMGKAGPNVLFESIALGRPFIATAYIPGQEQGNLDFIRRYHLGWVALDSASQRELIGQMTKDRFVITDKLQGVKAYRAWNQQVLQGIRPAIAAMLNPQQPD